MGRRRGFFAELQHQRAVQLRQQQRFAAEQARLARQATRERERAFKEQQRTEAQAKAQQDEYVRSQQAEAAELTRTAQERTAELETVLVNGLNRPGTFSFDQLRLPFRPMPFTPDPALANPNLAPHWAQFAPPPPTGMSRVFKAGHKRATEQARARFEHETTQFQLREQHRLAALADAQATHTAAEAERQQQVEQHNAKVGGLQRGVERRAPDSCSRRWE